MTKEPEKKGKKPAVFTGYREKAPMSPEKEAELKSLFERIAKQNQQNQQKE